MYAKISQKTFIDEILANYGTAPPPDAWSILVEATTMFKNQVKKVEIPNTASVQVLFDFVFFSNKLDGLTALSPP